MHARLDILLKEVEKPVAGWYKSTLKHCEKYLVFSKDGLTVDYGFNCENEWFKVNKQYPTSIIESDYPASPEEVETRMVKLMSEKYPQFDQFSFHSTNDRNRFNKGYGWNEVGDTEAIELFNNGKWAEIIEEPKLTLGGHEVTVTEDKDIICFNGEFLYIEAVRYIVESNIENFRMSGQPDQYQVDELKELLTKIEER